MGGGSIQLARILGIRVGVSPSWFFVLFLMIYSLSGYFDDVLDEVISVATAMRDYGVAISAKGIIDQSATAKERANRTR
jgi:hypothetical protein